jgi:hypothetical protein
MSAEVLMGMGTGFGSDANHYIQVRAGHSDIRKGRQPACRRLELCISRIEMEMISCYDVRSNVLI